MARNDDRVSQLVAPLLPPHVRLVKAERLASLWAGYGHISRLHFDDQQDAAFTRMLKVVAPPPSNQEEAEGHVRKLLSYRIEANFYRHFAPTLVACVPRLYGASDAGEGEVLLLEDLAVEFPVFAERRGRLDDAQAYRALEWLASFHAGTWGIEGEGGWCPPPLQAHAQQWNGEGLWEQGGYSYLATRMQELAAIHPQDPWAKLGLHAESPLPFAVDWCLNNPSDRKHLGLIHGDVKAANMVFSHTGMAMYDFQYVGKGLGVQDLAKLLATSVPLHLIKTKQAETKFLKTYHDHLVASLPQREAYPWDDFWCDWELALVSWVRFQAGWSGGFWGNVDWLTHRVETLLRDSQWTEGVIHRWQTNGGKIPNKNSH